MLTLTAVALHWLSLPAALVSLVLRFRSSVGVERQQLRWVAAGAALTLVGLLAGAFVAAAGYVAVLCVPVAVAVAVLRYRLWDLDRLVSRTVTYALVTGLLVLPYLLVVPVAGRLAAGTGSLGVAAATLAAAAGFAPLRRRVQALVDRRFNRRRYDAAHTLDRFAVRLRDQVDLDALRAELLTVVDQTVQPTQASLWLRAPATTRPSPNRATIWPDRLGRLNVAGSGSYHRSHDPNHGPSCPAGDGRWAGSRYRPVTVGRIRTAGGDGAVALTDGRGRP